MERAAGGTSQRLNPGLAIERLRSRKDNAPIAHTSFVKWPCVRTQQTGQFHWPVATFRKVFWGFRGRHVTQGLSSVNGGNIASRAAIHQVLSCPWAEGQPSARHYVPSHKHGMDTG